MKFSMFYIAEYANMVTASALMATLFFGGWDIPFTQLGQRRPLDRVVKTLATVGVFFAKTCLFLFLYIWVRWTLPRFRYDQLMALGWKVMLPLALAYLTVIATAIWYCHDRARVGVRHALRARHVRGEPGCSRVPLFFVLDRGASGAPARCSARSGLMAITVKIDAAARRAETSYLRATLKGMALTFTHLFRQEGDDAVPRGEGQRRLDALSRAGAARTAC